MAKDFNIELKNSKELEKLFNELQDKVKSKIIVDALKKAAQPIKKEVISNFKTEYKSTTNYKNLRKSFKISALKKAIGVKAGITDDFYMYRFLDKGTVDRYAKKVKKNGMLKKKTVKQLFRGKIKASNFFEAAVQKTESEVKNSIEKNIIEQINNTIKKYEK